MQDDRVRARPPRRAPAARRRARPGRGSPAPCRTAWRSRCARGSCAPARPGRRRRCGTCRGRSRRSPGPAAAAASASITRSASSSVRRSRSRGASFGCSATVASTAACVGGERGAPARRRHVAADLDQPVDADGARPPRSAPAGSPPTMSRWVWLSSAGTAQRLGRRRGLALAATGRADRTGIGVGQARVHRSSRCAQPGQLLLDDRRVELAEHRRRRRQRRARHERRPAPTARRPCSRR